jgi:D-tagatose-1,6-bisphosphate aldolase subunit GatZ/KbaZ
MFLINQGNYTLDSDLDSKLRLNIGAVSLNTIKAVIQTSSEITAVDYSLIASRRQIDTASLGHGYVNNFSTEDFVKFVRCYPGNASTLKLARDHGGPYQRDDESALTLHEALLAVKKSYEADISSGFNLIHIEPEKAVSHNELNSIEKFIEISKQLIGFCFEFKEKYPTKEFDFEIGTDEGVAKKFTVNDWDLFVSSLASFFQEKNQSPNFMLSMPLGTKVIDNSNLANSYSSTEIALLHEKVGKSVNLANKYGLQLKLHNADFLSKEMLNFYLSHGISNINIAPELGVLESKLIFNILKSHNFEHLSRKFMSLAYNSKNWKRWISDPEKLGMHECGIAAGHYIFSTPGFIQLKQEILETTKVGDLDTIIVSEIKKYIKHYLPRNE